MQLELQKIQESSSPSRPAKNSTKKSKQDITKKCRSEREHTRDTPPEPSSDMVLTFTSATSKPVTT